MPRHTTVYVVDNDPEFSAFLKILLTGIELPVEIFRSPREFLAAFDPSRCALLMIELRLPEMSGVEVLRSLGERGPVPPAIMMSSWGDASLAAEAIKAGARHYIEKPFRPAETQSIIDAVQTLLRTKAAVPDAHERDVRGRYDHLSAREREIADLVVQGRSSKTIGLSLGVSPRTIEGHRARILAKLGAENTAALSRILGRQSEQPR